MTYQLPEDYAGGHLKEVARVSRLWDESYSPLRTQRVCLCPQRAPVPISRFRDLSHLCDVTRVRWFNVPLAPFRTDNVAALMKFGHSVLSEYSRAFVNVLGVVDGQMDGQILNHTANMMRRVSAISPDGKDNFRLGLSVNIKPDGPFFPFTYSSGRFGFSIALELTQDINKICERRTSSTLMQLRQEILDTLVPQVERIDGIARHIARQTGMEFKGFDFSLAPIIDPYGSVISILNALGVYDFGRTGSLFATGFLTNILRHLASRFPSVGFSGVMYSLLEDMELCAINNERGVSLYQMISLSTMCGCGVDMVPVYGQMKNEEFMAIFMDVAAISTRLNKPLGVRILPIPSCKRGNTTYTSFHDDPDFIANTKVVTPNLNLLTEMGCGVFHFLTQSQ